MVFFSSLLLLTDSTAVHGSDDNVSGEARRATVVNVFRDETQSAADEPLLEGLPLVPRGQVLQGKFLPLLHEVRQQQQQL